MSSKQRILINTALLTASALLIRIVGMLFQAKLASTIGAEGIGLYQLSGSFTVFFSVFAVSGIRFAATKLVSEETSSGHGTVSGAMRVCIAYALVFGSLSCGALWYMAKPLGFLWVGDARVVLSLRIASAAMPFIAISAVFSGCFTALGKVWKMVLVQLITVAINLLFTFYLLSRSDCLDLRITCAAITIGSVVSEVFGCVFLLSLFLAERYEKNTISENAPWPTKRMLSAALPLAVSSYVRTGLNTLEHMFIPKGLKLSGLTAEAALSSYGIIQGMALPTVLFPACLLFSLAELIVPELTRAQSQGRTEGVLHIVQVCRSWTLIYAVISAAALSLFAGLIAETLFHTPECADAIRSLAPLVPIMNLDTITDGCLRGLGQQSRVMMINILDAALGVLIVMILIPHSGLKGYLLMIWITETINCILSTFTLNRIIRKSNASG